MRNSLMIESPTPGNYYFRGKAFDLNKNLIVIGWERIFSILEKKSLDSMRSNRYSEFVLDTADITIEKDIGPENMTKGGSFPLFRQNQSLVVTPLAGARSAPQL
jgi:hypothetical protein